MRKNNLIAGLSALVFILSFTFVSVQAQDNEIGDLWLVEEESVSPSNVADYIQWGKDFKALAEADGFQTFFVASENNVFSYAWNLGKTHAGLDEFDKKFQEWGKANPKLGEMYNKYSYTLDKRTRYLWRHLPKYSYNVEGYDSSENTYVRIYRAWIKSDKMSEAMAVLEEYRKINQEANISRSFNVYINVFGSDTNCVTFRSTYKDAADWGVSMNEFNEKVAEEKRQAIFGKWSNVIQKSEDRENWINSDLTYVSPN